MPDDPNANDFVGSGTLGGGLTWNLTKVGTLTVFGNGAMPDFSSTDEQPWKGSGSQIRNVIFLSGREQSQYRQTSSAMPYYYNPNTRALEWVCRERAEEDGTARLTFTHASDYLIVVDSYGWCAIGDDWRMLPGKAKKQ